MKRKIDAIQKRGGGCQVCGYNKNLAGLTFHHREPEFKSFTLNMRTMSNMTEAKIVAELEKCDLLCQNCHAEHHNPQLSHLL